MLPYFRPWLDAWVESAYGEGGFWRTARPRDHFRTASSSSSWLAAAVVALLREHPEITRVLEIGAGDGQLLGRLNTQRSDLELTGVDLGPRPEGLESAVEWCQDLWDVTAGQWSGAAVQLLGSIDRPTLVLALEWLDDLPCHLAVRESAAGRTIEVDPSGAERTGARLDPADEAWLSRWWPVGSRLEVGRTRDLAWASLLGHLTRYGGLGLAVDYGHQASTRPAGGSLQAFRGGRQVAPAPRTDRNLTAAVAVDALAEAGEWIGATTVWLSRQREVLGSRPTAEAPDPADDHDPADARDPLTDLVRRSEQATLVDPAVWGDQWWLLQQVPATGRVTTAGSSGSARRPGSSG